MIKQIKRKAALTILATIVGLTIGSVLNIKNASNQMTTQNSTLNEQQLVEDITFPSLEPNNIIITKTPLFSNSFLGGEFTSSDTTTETEENEQKNENETTQKEDNSFFNSITDKEWDILYRVARCEAGNWCKNYTECGKCSRCADAKEGQKNVIYVILNRLNNKKFPNNIKDIVFAPSQFTVTNSKKFYSVEISDYCKQNVQEAVKDYEIGISAQGALYFNCVSADYWNWADYIFTDAVGHYFFK